MVNRSFTTGGTFNETREGNLKDGLWDGNVQSVMNVIGRGTYDMSFVAVNGVPEDKTEEYCAIYTDYGYDAPIIDGYVIAFDDDIGLYSPWRRIELGETMGTIGYGDRY